MISSARLTMKGRENPDGLCILYWMIAARRSTYNHSLQHAIDLAIEHELPLVVIEPLALKHKWANDRISTFVLQGMEDNRAAFEGSNVTYIPYVETKEHEAKGLLKAWMKKAKICVIDDYPTYYPQQVIQAALHMELCELHLVDSNGFMPMRAQGRDFSTAYSLRRHLHKTILEHMADFPKAEPLIDAHSLPVMNPAIIGQIFEESETPTTPYEFLWRVSEGGDVGAEALSILSIDHSVKPVMSKKGGTIEAVRRWNDFLKNRLSLYSDNRNAPTKNGSSGLSPWMHFGHLSVHRMLHDIFTINMWDIGMISLPNDGRRSGWWGLSESVEAFLDQLITWRDLGFIHCAMIPNHDHYDSLPDWAQATLEEHAHDPRPFMYTFEEFEQAKTHDELWNAAQNQLKRDGIIHNYLRMLWGKKILEWAPSPQQAMEWMVALNDKWALDGRDPNSYTGIGWVLGKFDRGWTERPIYGKIRCMTSDSTRRKQNVKPYVEKYTGSGSLQMKLGSGPTYYSSQVE